MPLPNPYDPDAFEGADDDDDDIEGAGDALGATGSVSPIPLKFFPLGPVQDVGAGASVTFSAQPAERFIPLGLVIQSDAGAPTGLVVSEVLCGQVRQLMSAGDIGAMAFAHDSGLELQFDVCPDNQNSSVTVRNVSAAGLTDVSVAFVGVVENRYTKGLRKLVARVRRAKRRGR